MNEIVALQEKIANSNVESIKISSDAKPVVLSIRIPGGEKIRMRMHANALEAPNIIFQKGSYEKDETEMMYRILSCIASMQASAELCIFDIGSNVGYYTLCFKTWFPQAEVSAFEPLTHTYDHLSDNLALNGYDVSLNQFGFFDSEKTIEFYYNDEESGATSIKNIRGIEESKKILCQVKPMDSYVQSIGAKIDFIKCDVEGAELSVFKGGVHTLKEQRPVVFTEMLRKWSAKFGYHPNDIIALFHEMGYACYVIGAGGSVLLPLQEVTEETVETNYIFIHSSEISKFEKLL